MSLSVAAFVYSKKEKEYNESASHYYELRRVNLAQHKEIQELKVKNTLWFKRYWNWALWPLIYLYQNINASYTREIRFKFELELGFIAVKQWILNYYF